MVRNRTRSWVHLAAILAVVGAATTPRDDFSTPKLHLRRQRFHPHPAPPSSAALIARRILGADPDESPSPSDPDEKVEDDSLSSDSSSSHSRHHHSRWRLWVQNAGVVAGVLCLCYCRCFRLPPSRRIDAYTELVAASRSWPVQQEGVVDCLEFCGAIGRSRLVVSPGSKAHVKPSFTGPLALPLALGTDAVEADGLATGASALSSVVLAAGAVQAFGRGVRVGSLGRVLDSLSTIEAFHGPVNVHAITLRLAVVAEIDSRVDFYAKLLVQPSQGPSRSTKSATRRLRLDAAYVLAVSVFDRGAVRRFERTKYELFQRCARWRRLCALHTDHALEILNNRRSTWLDVDPNHIPASSRLEPDQDFVHLWTPIDSRAAAVVLGRTIFVLDVDTLTIDKFEPNCKLRLSGRGAHSDSKTLRDALDATLDTSNGEPWIRPDDIVLIQFSRLHYAALAGPGLTTVDLPSLPARIALRRGVRFLSSRRLASLASSRSLSMEGLCCSNSTCGPRGDSDNGNDGHVVARSLRLPRYQSPPE